MSALYLPETQDSQFPAWSGPYCLVLSEAESSCSEAFDCNFSEDFSVKLPHQAKLCCRSVDEPWSAKFLETEEKKRVFSASKFNKEVIPENAVMLDGHFGLTELIFNPPKLTTKPLYIKGIKSYDCFTEFVRIYAPFLFFLLFISTNLTWERRAKCGARITATTA